MNVLYSIPKPSAGFEGGCLAKTTGADIVSDDSMIERADLTFNRPYTQSTLAGVSVSTVVTWSVSEEKHEW